MPEEKLLNTRIYPIDIFRGLTMMLMIIVNYLSGIKCIPAFFKHAQDIGLTITDLVAPAFIFAIGLTYKLSFERRAQSFGLKKTYYHFAVRFLALTGIGAFFTGGAAIVSIKEAAGAWGVLQSIGAAGLITLIFIRAGTLARFIIGLALLFSYQLMLDNFWLRDVLNSSQGGLMAVISWGALLILSTALADLYHKRENKLFYGCASLTVLAAGILSSIFFAVSKHRVSISYILISAGVASTVFYLVDVLFRVTELKVQLIEWWGKNPLFIYLIHMLLLGVTFLPGNEVWYIGAPLWSALLQLGAFFAALSVIAWLLHKKKVYLKI